MSKSQPFRVLERGDLRVVSVHGDLDLRTASALATALTTALSVQPPASLVVDLTACSFMDSSGIARLLHADDFARKADVTFAVVADPQTQPCRVLKLTRCLPDRLQWFSNLPSAEAALCRRPRRRFPWPASPVVDAVR